MLTTSTVRVAHIPLLWSSVLLAVPGDHPRTCQSYTTNHLQTANQVDSCVQPAAASSVSRFLISQLALSKSNNAELAFHVEPTGHSSPAIIVSAPWIYECTVHCVVPRCHVPALCCMLPFLYSVESGPSDNNIKSNSTPPFTLARTMFCSIRERVSPLPRV